MTVSTTRTNNPDIAALLRDAFMGCGVVNEYQDLSPAQATRGRSILDKLIDHLQVEGIAARTRPFETLTLVSGTRDYLLATSTLDVEGDGAFIDVGQDVDAASGETPVIAMTTQEWQGLSSKDATGRPMRYWVDRTTDTLSVSFWPTPAVAETGASVRFVVHRLRADNMNGAATVDLERYWHEYIQWALMERIALAYSLNMNRVGYFAQRAEQILAKCRSAAAPTVATGFMVGHSTPWSR